MSQSFESLESAIRSSVQRALEEDLVPDGDLTAALVSPELVTSGTLTARQGGILAGSDCATETFRQIDTKIKMSWHRKDGDRFNSGDALATLEGSLAKVLTAERTALNFLSHLSGIATVVAKWVEQAGDGAIIWDTRKTIPGLRAVEKAAVLAGGGANHRHNLSDWVMLKDNHLTGTTITDAVMLSRQKWPDRAVHVECDSFGQVQEALDAEADILLLDNMTPEEIKHCVSIVDKNTENGTKRPLLEASGGITLDIVSNYSNTGVDYISSGVLTNSAPALDIGLDLINLG
ncbi:MAG TPA: carboxylating nicotinate-nucleotide diphosphorylase [Acidimicrobiales bacterium]|nr:carboxylating nicotinate-nucleotide diphosphorylase [Acidimicrobiales bacterium]|tara:strand:- start:2862 stop:3731 length:870 start_codon:yes stop_codon:yes gene_type:complete